MAPRKTPSDGTIKEAVKAKRKRVKVKAGQIVAVPLLDGSWALAHVAASHLGIIVAHYDHRAERPEQLLHGMDDAMRARLFSVLAVTNDEIYDGHWPVIGYKEPEYPAEMLDTKGRSYTASATRCLFEAVYGLRAWDEMAVPRWYDRMLLPGSQVPASARYKADFEKAAGLAAAATDTPVVRVEPDAPITEGAWGHPHRDQISWRRSPDHSSPEASPGHRKRSGGGWHR